MTDMIGLRPATVGDARRWWEWRNEPATRAASFETAPIPYETHIAWFRSKLDDANARLWIAADSTGREVGFTRIELTGNTAEMSMSLDAGRRRENLGATVIKAAAERAFADLGVRSIVARVRAENAQSVAVFRRAGFTVAGRTTIAGADAVEMVWPPTTGLDR